MGAPSFTAIASNQMKVIRMETLYKLTFRVDYWN
jgi:hypothetical protein